jgi:hypothetical protein
MSCSSARQTPPVPFWGRYSCVIINEMLELGDEVFSAEDGKTRLAAIGAAAGI